MTDDSDPTPPLADGVYDGFIVDVDEPDEPGGATRLHITIIAGERKGEVIDVAATHLDASFVDLMGVPVTITVAAGQPSVQLDS